MAAWIGIMADHCKKFRADLCMAQLIRDDLDCMHKAWFRVQLVRTEVFQDRAGSGHA